ncbi:MAG: DEAD/DEAH box helicase [Cytophagales bacterium]|nr:MAG: DEAD/DEAH box helicase [Cytophagales bacterium]
MKSFEISPKTLANLGIESLNEMQIAANQEIQDKKNVLLLAPTGSGKTLAFLLPIANLLDANTKGIQCLILVPSRELALQIEQVWRKIATGFKVNTCYGGHSVQTEVQNLTEVPTVLIGTPGRICDHIQRQSISLKDTQILVLDEFDKSLAMGFEQEMGFIVQKLHKLEKRILVSATSQLKIPEFVGIKQPTLVDFTKTQEKTTDGLVLKTVISEGKDKMLTLFRLLCFLGEESTLIFCNLRETAEQTCQALQEKGLEVAFFHGKMEQLDREKTLVNFRNRSVTFLLASDLAARGLDIPAVKNVIHYELPFNHEDFTHRNGRTARMNAEGTAYLMLEEGETKPSYLQQLPNEFRIPKKTSLPKPSEWATLYVSGGKKNKISKIDIVGFLSKKGSLEKDDIGLIEVMDFMSFVAVKKHKINSLLKLVQGEKMKGEKYKIELAKVKK